MTLFSRKLLTGLLALLAATSLTFSQARAAYSQAELDQMLAPIALYPDPLLSQILMASTYPIEVVEAARWSRANPGLQGDAAVRAVQNKEWDPSVKSLVAFPQVLRRMDENLEWTRRLGEAFIVQEPVVMETVQALRRRAQAAGQLASDDRVRVVEEAQSIVVVPANPQLIYVPYYDPWLAYGPWWWPAYPPIAWAPWPGYVRVARPGPSASFWWGAPVGVSVGFFFGGLDWWQRQVRVVHVNNFYVRPAVTQQRTVILQPGPWRHDPERRRFAGQRDPVARPPIAAPAPLREQRRAEPARTIAPRTEPRRDEPREGSRRPPESRRDLNRPERQAETRREEPRPAPASPLTTERMPPARAQSAPAPRVAPNSHPRAERGPAPRVEHQERRNESKGEREH